MTKKTEEKIEDVADVLEDAAEVLEDLESLVKHRKESSCTIKKYKRQS